MTAPGDSQIRQAQAILAEAGIEGAVRVEGHADAIAVLQIRAEAWGELLGETGVRVADRLKALGFRYVAVDLDLSA